MSDFVSSRRIGDAEVTIISEGTLRWAPKFPVSEDEYRRAIPDADENCKVTIGLNAAHVRLGNASVIIDPGCDDRPSMWVTEFTAKWPGLVLSPRLGAELKRIGVEPATVTHVLLTHAHEDHFAGVAAERETGLVLRFPRARHVIGRRDWDENPARRQADSPLVRRLGLAERQGLLGLVDEDREIVPGITMITSPGETPGHFCVRVESAGRRFYYLGDLFHLPCEVEHIEWAPSHVRLVDTLIASRRRVLADAAGGDSVIMLSHGLLPPWGRAVRAGGGYRWERDQRD